MVLLEPIPRIAAHNQIVNRAKSQNVTGATSSPFWSPVLSLQSPCFAYRKGRFQERFISAHLNRRHSLLFSRHREGGSMRFRWLWWRSFPGMPVPEELKYLILLLIYGRSLNNFINPENTCGTSIVHSIFRLIGSAFRPKPEHIPAQNILNSSWGHFLNQPVNQAINTSAPLTLPLTA